MNTIQGSSRVRPAPFAWRPGRSASRTWHSLPGSAYRARSFRTWRSRILAPDLAVEVLSEGNTKGEMERKLKDYFFAGVRLVWYIDLKKRTAAVYTSPDEGATLTEDQSLDGGAVLPGFRLSLRKLFARPTPPGGRKRTGRKKST